MVMKLNFAKKTKNKKNKKKQKNQDSRNFLEIFVCVSLAAWCPGKNGMLRINPKLSKEM